MQTSDGYNVYENNNDEEDDEDFGNVNLDYPDDDDNVFDNTPSTNTSEENSTSCEQINMLSHDFKQSLGRHQHLASSITPSASSYSNSSSSVVVPAHIPTRQPVLSMSRNNNYILAPPPKNPPISPAVYQNQRLPSSSTFLSAKEPIKSAYSSSTAPTNPHPLASSTGSSGSAFSPERLINKTLGTVNAIITKRLPINPYISKQPSHSTSSARQLNKSSQSSVVHLPANRNRFQAINSSSIISPPTERQNVSIGASLNNLTNANHYGQTLKPALTNGQPNETPNVKVYLLPDSMTHFCHFDVQSVFFSYAEVKTKKEMITSSGNMRSGASAASKQIDELIRRNFSSSVSQFSYSSGQEAPSISPSSSCEQTLVKPKVNSSIHLYLNESHSSISDSSMSLATPSESNKGSLTHKSSDGQSLKSGQYHHHHQLVDECPFFQIETGGDAFMGLGLIDDVSQRRLMKLNSLSILNKENINYTPNLVEMIDANDHEMFPIEYLDWGSYFYRYYFADYEHANYLGVDREIGPVIVSIRREKILVDADPPAKSPSKRILLDSNYKNGGKDKMQEYVYRVIIRTADLIALRGTIAENYLQSMPHASKGVSHKQIIRWILPELDSTCLRLGEKESKLSEALLDFDEKDSTRNYKVGVLLCKASQVSEEEMYNNKDSTPEFEEFLRILGDKVTLKNFSKFTGGLDSSADTTGTHSVYTQYQEREIMFHVSTLLPYTPNDKQQVARKRHIGNDLVTVVFQEFGSSPFSPKNIRSHFQHVFIVVRAMVSPQQIAAGRQQQYSIAVSYSKDMPHFGPPLPKNPLFVKSKEFRDFLLAKIINADNAGLKCKKLMHLKLKSRHGLLLDMISKYSSKITLENCGISGSGGNGSAKFGIFKKFRSRSDNGTLITSSNENLAAAANASLYQLNDGLFWTLDNIEDSNNQFKNCCYFGVSKQNVLVVDASRKNVVFSINCNAVIGWTVKERSQESHHQHTNKLQHSQKPYQLILYFDLGEHVVMTFKSKQDLHHAAKRLEYFTKGCKTVELNLDKKDCGELGFQVQNDGVVTEVEPNSIAYCQGLRQGTRIVKICDYYVVKLSQQKMIDLFCNSSCLRVSFLPPLDNGNARRGHVDSCSLFQYLSTCSGLNNERSIDSKASYLALPTLCGPNLIANNVNNSVHGLAKSPLLSIQSPTFSRKLSQSSRRQSAYSTSKLVQTNDVEEPCLKGTRKRSTRSNAVLVNGSEQYFKALDHGVPLNNQEAPADPTLPMTYSQKVRLGSSGNQSGVYPAHNTKLHSVSSMNHKMPANDPKSDWTMNLIRNSMKSFEIAHPDYYQMNMEPRNKPPTPSTNGNYISTSEIINTQSEFPSLNGDTGQNYIVFKERKYSYDELQEKCLRLENELSLERKEKMIAKRENSDLKEALTQMEIEKKQLNDQIATQKYYNSRAHSRTNSTNSATGSGHMAYHGGRPPHSGLATQI